MLNAESETQRPAPPDASGSVSSWAMLAAYVNAYWEAVSFMSCFGLQCWNLGDESAHRLSGWSHRSNSRAEKSPAWPFIHKCLLFGRICVGFSMVQAPSPQSSSSIYFLPAASVLPPDKTFTASLLCFWVQLHKVQGSGKETLANFV